MRILLLNKVYFRCESDSIISSDDDLDELPENILQTEKILNASAIKNNLNETGVRKIIKVSTSYKKYLAEYCIQI